MSIVFYISPHLQKLAKKTTEYDDISRELKTQTRNKENAIEYQNKSARVRGASVFSSISGAHAMFLTRRKTSWRNEFQSGIWRTHVPS
jgi:hypothetical protein